MIKKRILFFVMLMSIAFLTLPAGATITRDMGFGLNENPWIIDGLQSNIYVNPAFITEFQDQILFEKTENNIGGIIYSLMENLFLGFFSGSGIDNDVWNNNNRTGLYHMGDYENKSVAAAEYQATLLSDGSTTIDLDDPDSPLRKYLNKKDINLVIGYAVNDQMALGLNFTYATSWVEKDLTNFVQEKYLFSNSEIGVGLGGIYDINNEMSLNLNFLITMYTLSNTYESSSAGVSKKITYESDGAMDIGTNVGFKMILSPEQKIHINTGFAMLNRSTKGGHSETAVVNSNDDYQRSGTEITFGVADELTISKNVVGFIGMNLSYTSFSYAYSGVDTLTSAKIGKYDISSTEIVIPLFIGIEGKMTDNWTGRFGIAHNIFDPYKEDGTNILNDGSEIGISEGSDDSTDTDISLGITYKLGNFKFDWVVNMDLLVRGPDFVSGHALAYGTVPDDAEQATDFSTAFAVTYIFKIEPEAEKKTAESMSLESKKRDNSLRR